MRCYLLGLAALLGGWPVAVWGEDPAPAAIKKIPETTSKLAWICPHLGGRKIGIDGRIDEAGWKIAAPLQDFTLVKTLKRPQWATTARVVFDDKYLYVAFECEVDAIRSPVKQRDDHVWEGDAAELFLCPRGADAFYYEIDFTPKNVVYDCRLESWKYEPQSKFGDKWAAGFNAKIESETNIQENEKGEVTGWSLEAKIPFADLDMADRKAPADGDVWLFNTFRGLPLKDGKTWELQHWGPVTPEFHRPHQFPRLKFVRLP